MLRFREACNGCSFYFPAGLVRKLLVKTVFASCYLKLSLPVFLKCFLIFATFSLVSYKKRLFESQPACVSCLNVS